jgi:hypothetical protein
VIAINDLKEGWREFHGKSVDRGTAVCTEQLIRCSDENAKIKFGHQKPERHRDVENFILPQMSTSTVFFIEYHGFIVSEACNSLKSAPAPRGPKPIR